MIPMIDNTKFPRSARLTTPKEYNLVFKQAKQYKFKEFTVYTRQNNLNYSRLGLAVSKKAAKKAVTRNKIKRIIRENFRLHRENFIGWDIIVVVRASIVLLHGAQINLMLSKTWDKLGSRCVN